MDSLADTLSIFDGLKSVRLLRRGSATTLVPGSALPRPLSQREIVNSNGEYLTQDAKWHCAADAFGAITPVIGDTLVDDTGARWVILEVWRLPLLEKIVCVARNLALVYGLDTIAIVEELRAEKDTSGALKQDWITRYTVRAKFQEDRRYETTEHNLFGSARRVMAYLEEQIEIEPTRHRLRDSNGAAYRVTEIVERDNLARPLIVACEMYPWIGND